ncbi:hypothetical protein AAF712_015882 [Marasmius tenuissimus]|uniref:Uncharacterized protein n=1 Tax=Marasmius tenuissimus TaxID=585030 RepID=A0ABR2Z903_9AGAR
MFSPSDDEMFTELDELRCNLDGKRDELGEAQLGLHQLQEQYELERDEILMPAYRDFKKEDNVRKQHIEEHDECECEWPRWEKLKLQCDEQESSMKKLKKMIKQSEKEVARLEQQVDELADQCHELEAKEMNAGLDDEEEDWSDEDVETVLEVFNDGEDFDDAEESNE